MSFEEMKDDLSPNMDRVNNVQKGEEMNPNVVKKKCSKCGRVTYDRKGICMNCQKN